MRRKSNKLRKPSRKRMQGKSQKIVLTNFKIRVLDMAIYTVTHDPRKLIIIVFRTLFPG